MKKTIKTGLIVSFSTTLLSGCAINEIVDYGEINNDNIKTNIEIRYDEFQKVYFIKPVERYKYLSIESLLLTPYLVISPNGETSRRLQISKRNPDGWLFMNGIHVLCPDGEFKRELGHFSVKREAIHGSETRESVDIAISKDELSLLNGCLGGKIRVNGKKIYSESTMNLRTTLYGQELDYFLENFDPKKIKEHKEMFKL